MDVVLYEDHEFRFGSTWWKDVVPDTSSQAIKYIEVGASRGHNIVAIARSYAAHPESVIYAVDTWADDDAGRYDKDHFDAMMSKYNLTEYDLLERVKPIKGALDEVLSTFNDQEFDIVHIYTHDFQKITACCEIAANKVKQGGFVIVDNTHEPEILEKSKSVYDNPSKSMELVSNKEQLCIYQKK